MVHDSDCQLTLTLKLAEDLHSAGKLDEAERVCEQTIHAFETVTLSEEQELKILALMSKLADICNLGGKRVEAALLQDQHSRRQTKTRLAGGSCGFYKLINM